MSMTYVIIFLDEALTLLAHRQGRVQVEASREVRL